MKKIIIVLLVFGLNYIEAKMIRDSSTTLNEVIFDTSTTLMWQDDNDALLNSKTWIDAIAYCEDSSKKSYTNWRLPNINELNTISDDSKYNPVSSSIFINVASERYWSSTSAKSNTAYAWIIDFNDSREDYISKTTAIRVRCVRDTL